MKDICGIDEAGRGALAGPLVAGSVFVSQGQKKWLLKQNLLIRDSKKLSEIQRERVYEAVAEREIIFEVEVIGIDDINTFGIGWANTTAIKRVIKRIGQHVSSRAAQNPVQYVVDGYFPQQHIAVSGVDIRCETDADATVFPVILAGIVAKVTRDRLMKKLHQDFASYGWERNKGYGTNYHIEALKKWGVCTHHRTQFVKTALKNLTPNS